MHTARIFIIAVSVAAAFICNSGCSTKLVLPPLVCGGVVTTEQVEERTQKAGTTEYSWARLWVEQHCPTNPIPTLQRVFVIREMRPRAAYIVSHQSGLTLDDILRATGIRGGNPRVLREDMPVTNKAFETGDLSFEIRPLDLVIITGRPAK